MCRLAFRQRAPYTILPDAPAEQSDNSETAEAERDRLAADLDAAQKRYQGVINAQDEELTRLRAEVAELETKLEEREADMHMRVRAEYDKTIADCWREAIGKVETERDALLAERNATVTVLAEYGHIETSKHLADSVRAALKECSEELVRLRTDVLDLRAEEEKLTRQRFDLCEAAGYYHDADCHPRIVDDSCVSAAIRGVKRATEELERLRAELAPYQLPADGEPLTLVQIVPALLADRVLREVIHTGPPAVRRLWRYHDGAFEHRHPLSAEWYDDYLILDSGSEWQMDPLPTPEPRQLTFAEAVALGRQLAGRSEYRVMATWDEYEMRSVAGCGVAIWWRDMSYALQPEMLAATWTEVLR
jgi:hypothetical protein